jgi:Cu/Ag efflux pump CusA
MIMNKLLLSIFDQRMKTKAVLTAVAVLLAVIAAVRFGSVSVSSQPDTQGRDEVRIELTSNGFAPSEVQHAPGTFAIAVENNTLPGEYTLRLKAEDGTLLSELHVQKGSSAWSVSLQSGRYTLTEAGHSQWLCNIVVQ